MMKKFFQTAALLLVILLSYSSFAFAQERQNFDPSIQTLEDKEFKELWDKAQPKISLLENIIFKNVFLYRLTLTPTIKDLTDYLFFKRDNIIIDSLIPDYNVKLDILIKPINYLYVKDNYICLSIAQSEQNSSPITYDYYNRFFPYDNDFLIAFNPFTNDIDFLSGNFYKSKIDIKYYGKNIYNEYGTNINEFGSLKMRLSGYIHFRLYQLLVQNVREEGIDENFIYFSAYSKQLEQRVKIKISLMNFKDTEKNYLEYNGNMDVFFYMNNIQYVFPVVISPKSYEEIRIRAIN